MMEQIGFLKDKKTKTTNTMKRILIITLMLALYKGAYSQNPSYAKPQVEFQGSDIASASTLNITTVGGGNAFDVTGTTGITAINADLEIVGLEIELHFDGALTLTHSTDLVLPTGANITTAVGDIAKFRQYAADDWRCTSYTRADGTALTGGGTTINGTTDNGILTYINSSGEIQTESGVTYDGTLNVDNISSLTTNTDITLSGNGSGVVEVNDDLNVNQDLTVTGTSRLDLVRISNSSNEQLALAFGVSSIIPQLGFYNNTTLMGRFYQDQSNSDFYIETLTNNGDIVVNTHGTGVLDVNTSVDFSGDLTASNYETGSFTPVLADAESAGNEATGGTSTGRYSRTGDVVTVIIKFVNKTTSGLTGGNDVYITGLPFTISSGVEGVGSVGINSSSFSGYLTAFGKTGTTVLRLKENESGAAVDYVTCSEMTSGQVDIYISMTYQL